MLLPSHLEHVSDFVNRELTLYIAREASTNHLMNGPSQRKRDSKLERMMKQTCMVVESLSDEFKYASASYNANRRKRGFNTVQTNGKFFEHVPQYPRNMGMRVPHHDYHKESD